jgi:hypothetical protein
LIRVPAHRISTTKVVVGLAVVLAIVAAAGSLHMMGVFTPAGLPQPQAVDSTDGVSKVRVPPDWYPGHLNPNAVLEVGNQFKDVYLIVITDAKIDFGEVPTLTDYAQELIGNKYCPCDNPVVISGPDELVIDDRKAIQYEYHGTMKNTNIRIHYLDTAVDGRQHFHRILTWTLESRFPQHRPQMERVTNSFREISKPN